ncbi:hypothetical protein [Clostridium vincentii]|uniref:Uncharacterized protein n=1 Tax=Clostridium vincentii TaxID=52704 RepID=A0A2T0BB94_9CLOT|nr:hypothetical protein [Clostridium vincentii]PRR81087.1 hypothetical protein CLVI_27610 [Clostridium vincentii]
MRKSTILTIAGTFIIMTGLLCNLGKSASYSKKINFSEPEEVLGKLNSSTLAAFENSNLNGSDIIYTYDFYECLSSRKRLTSPGVIWSDVDLNINKDKDPKAESERIINDYLTRGKNLKNFKSEKKIQAYNLSGTCIYVYNGKSNIEVDVVLIDEGKGWVIDYFMVRSDVLEGEQNDSSRQ